MVHRVLILRMEVATSGAKSSSTATPASKSSSGPSATSPPTGSGSAAAATALFAAAPAMRISWLVSFLFVDFTGLLWES